MGILTIEEFENAVVLKVNKGLIVKYIEIKECSNPFCGCGNFKMVCINRQNSYQKNKVQTFSFEGNIFDESIIMFEDAKSTDAKQHQRIYDFLNENLEVSDWNAICAVFEVNKARRIDEFSVNEMDDYEYVFEDKHIEETNLRIQLHEIFPWRERFVVEQNGIQYELVEAYCKSVECECTLMNFSLYENEEEYFGDFDYDYTTGKINKQEYAWVIEQLTAKDEWLNILLENRNLFVRCLYTKTLIDIKKFNLKKNSMVVKDIKQQKPETDQHKNVGRNEKCPCGSGKKFKKCCLKIIESW